MVKLPEIATSENMDRLSELNRISSIYSDENIDSYLIGSWAVSALNRAFIKDHIGDIDIVVAECYNQLERAVGFLNNMGYTVLEERNYIRTTFVEKWFRLQKRSIQIEIGNGFRGERIPREYVRNPIFGNLCGSSYKIVPLAWLIRSYFNKGDKQLISFLKQYGESNYEACE